ncbi:MAG TPA: FIST N-terminal domain-containing protein [Isosphaeraceae bacterium]|nr:FIST N-terminal domain-containing protein [Isosphaeraceae bacterium]
MKCAEALSTESKSANAVADVLDRVAEGLGDGPPANLAVVFASAEHAEALPRLAREALDRDLVQRVIGCTGETIIAEGREVEEGPAMALWALRAPVSIITPVRVEPGSEELAERLLAPADENSVLLLLGDPFTFPADAWLKRLDAARTGLRVAGGMASAGRAPGSNRLVLDDKAFADGAVAMRVDLHPGDTIRSVVSQGCRPIGRPLIVTKVEANLVRELGRRPALQVLREIFDALTDDEQQLARQGLHLGRVINEYQDTFRRGDFLVRNVLGADDAGGIAISDLPRVGQTVQFHVRDAATADEDLRALLADPDPSPDHRVAGALLFSCNGRGTRLFPDPDHDARTLRDLLGPVPVAGFFAMGEFGPVGDQNFVHGFTASVAVFREQRVIRHKDTKGKKEEM